MKQFYNQVCQIHPFSIGVIEAGFFMMIAYFLCSKFALFLLPYSHSSLAMISLSRLCLEAAPASFAAGITAGLLCDLILADPQKFVK